MIFGGTVSTEIVRLAVLAFPLVSVAFTVAA